MKVRSGWYSDRVRQYVQVVRWGTVGRPVLLFPTAGGDAEECERFLMLDALAPLLDAGRIKVYACDSVSGRAWIDGNKDGNWKARMQSAFNGFIEHELVPAIRTDCNTADIEIIAAGASIGAFNALSTICRQPDAFCAAICMSGTYDMSRWVGGQHGFDHHVSSPLHFLPQLPDDSAQLRRLRRRFILLATGEGRYEAPGESWRVAQILGDRGVPNRVDPWGVDWHHDWLTWRAMLPKYLDELTSTASEG